MYDIDGDGYISNGELFTVLKMMVGDNLGDVQLQQASAPSAGGGGARAGGARGHGASRHALTPDPTCGPSPPSCKPHTVTHTHAHTTKTQHNPQVVDKTMIFADRDKDGRVSFEEFCEVLASSDVELDQTLSLVIPEGRP